MNKTRTFLPVFGNAAGCFCLLALPFTVRAQQGEDGSVRPTVKPVTTLAAAAPVATETASTPAPDSEGEEKSPPQDAPDENKDTVETDITAETGASFNSKDRVAIFVGNVKVVDPRFQLVCDKLTVFLNKPTPAGQNPPSTPAPTAAPAPTGKKGKGDPANPPGGGSGIDRVVAEGRVVILQKKAPTKPGEEEKVSVGRGDRGTFDNKTGDMVLTGWPSLEQNGSSLVSLAQSTVMTIHRDSSLDTKGPSKTTLKQKKGANNGASPFDIGPNVPTGGNKRSGNNAPPATAPAASPAPRRAQR